MCGICGELRFDGRAPELGAIDRMLEKLQRRGPDHGGSFSDGPLAFGHRRLAIIDLSPRGNQPMVDSALGLVLVFNGTIYNYKELRAELRSLGHQFFSDGDSEVILKAYAAWGEQCVERLHGMFAFAIWDQQRQSLFMARDRLGIKPLYYSLDAMRLRFGSNVQALLAGGGVDTAIDPVALHHQFTLHAVIPAPRTILNGVRKLAPGHTLTIHKDGTTELRRYWQLYATRPEQPRSDQEWTEMIHAALREAVKRRLDIADVQESRTVSGGCEDQPEERGSEFEFSDQVVGMYNTRHHKYSIPNEHVLQRLPEAVAQMAEPMVGQDAVAFYLLAERVSQE